MTYARHVTASRRTLFTAVIITSLIGVATGIVSYSHALYIARLAGNTGLIAYLVPLFADGLIVLSSTALYAAAQARVDRPGWATGGVIFGVVVTIVMNVSAGAAHGWTGALVGALAPVIFIVSLEVLTWLFRLARPPAPDDSPPQCAHGVPSSVDEAIRTDFLHRRDCLGLKPTYSEHGTRWGIDRRKVSELVAALSEPAAASMNGSGPDGA